MALEPSSYICVVPSKIAPRVGLGIRLKVNSIPYNPQFTGLV